MADDFFKLKKDIETLCEHKADPIFSLENAQAITQIYPELIKVSEQLLELHENKHRFKSPKKAIERVLDNVHHCANQIQKNCFGDITFPDMIQYIQQCNKLLDNEKKSKTEALTKKEFIKEFEEWDAEIGIQNAITTSIIFIGDLDDLYFVCGFLDDDLADNMKISECASLEAARKSILGLGILHGHSLIPEGPSL